jgi:hypothetical protein
MWRIDPLLGTDLEGSNGAAAVVVGQRGEHASATIELYNEREMGYYIRIVSGKRLDKNVSAATVAHATGEMECCIRGPRLGIKKKITGAVSSY